MLDDIERTASDGEERNDEELDMSKTIGTSHDWPREALPPRPKTSETDADEQVPDADVHHS